MFCRKGVLRNFAEFTGNTRQGLFLINLCQSLLFNKVAALRPVALLKRRLWHRSFPVNFVKFLRTPGFTEHLRWLLLSSPASCKMISEIPILWKNWDRFYILFYSQPYFVQYRGLFRNSSNTANIYGGTFLRNAENKVRDLLKMVIFY